VLPQSLLEYVSRGFQRIPRLAVDLRGKLSHPDGLIMTQVLVRKELPVWRWLWLAIRCRIEWDRVPCRVTYFALSLRRSLGGIAPHHGRCTAAGFSKSSDGAMRDGISRDREDTL
jgi:hypothetical protein